MMSIKALFSSLGWLVHVRHRKEEASETGSRDHTSIAPQYSSHSWLYSLPPWQMPWWWPGSTPLGHTNSNHIYCSSTYLLAAQDSKVPKGTWALLCCSSAIHYQPNILHPDFHWCKCHCSSHCWYKTMLVWYSYVHSANNCICTITAQGICSCYLGRGRCWKHGQKPVHYMGRQGLSPGAKSGHCSKTPSHSESEKDTGNSH